ncbi:MAG: sensor histidine kinase [Desulfobulbaceae bacterium]|nr:sensor histidine kinase [Desulfobulbaceae bacterium]
MKDKLSRKRTFWLSFTVFIFLLSFALGVVTTWSYKYGLAELEARSKTRLELYINYLQGVLEKYQSLPELLAIDNTLVHALLNPHEKTRIETLNKYLETINKVSDTLDTYLMNKDGLTIAASNWQERRPFIGRNFSYRPYFKQAMKGDLGRYFALGVTSSKRGYYFAYPVRRADEILGAVAIKISIDTVEQKWAQEEENFLVSDPDGVIFITTYPGWRYKTLEPLDEKVLQRIIESKRYPDEPLVTLSESSKTISDSVQILDIQVDNGNEMQRIVKQSQYMPQAGWNVHILTDTKALKRYVLSLNIIVGAALTVVYFLAVLLYQRQHRLAELRRIEQETKKALHEANEQLESRVNDRTQELTQTNTLLKKEILDRKKTEIKLKRTRKELIHAAKLAVLGQMSAGINHELNQPLAAIRSYADNGKQFLQKGRLDNARWNLEQIAELTERMAQIGVQLKLFSKKSSGQIVTIALHGVIDGAMEILNPTLKKSGVDMKISVTPKDVEVRGNHVLLQQVLVNLISNAIQALELQDHKEIYLQCVPVDGKISISVQDNGPGIPDKLVQEIFEPFFTTKKSGQGLGLGLTISDRIVRELGGIIRYVEFDQGARFEFALERVG